MKKRILTLLLAAVMVVALVPAVFAEDAPHGLTPDEVAELHPLSVSDGLLPKLYGDSPITLKTPDPFAENDDGFTTDTHERYLVIKEGTPFTVENLAPASDNTYVTICLSCYSYESPGVYTSDGYYESCYLTESGEFVPEWVGPEEELYGGWVELRSGESVEFSLPYDEHGQDTVYLLTIYHEYPDYEYEYWTYFTMLVDDDLYAQLTESTDPAPGPDVPAFTDVSANAYYADAVKWAVETEVTNGYPDGRFDPNGNCTRAQIVTFLWRAYGEQEPQSMVSPFSDVTDPGAYYYKAVLWASENDITSGTDDTHFSPNATCTRGQAVTFQWRAADKPSASGGKTFGDVADGAFYADAVKWAVENEITTGTTATTFDPNGTCTRGQIVTFLYRDLA